MAVVDGFWMGALSLYRGVDLPRLAEKAGGWRALKSAGVSGWIALGLSERRANTLAEAEDFRSDWSALSLEDDAYPAHLRDTPFPPPVLFTDGDQGCLLKPGVAVVGTRRCTPYGAGVAGRLGEGLAAGGRVVISGMAQGVDRAAHAGAVKSGRTIAVLGEGLSRSTRGYRAAIRRSIVNSGGLIVSTWPDTFEAQRWTFPIRNRWIAALADAVVVVEAPVRSGALITAQYAVELGREVYGVPAQVHAPMSQGVLGLLYDGAHPIVDLDRFILERSGAASREWESWLERILLGESVDAVARSTGRSVVELLVALSVLEAEGRLVKLAGGGYATGRRV